MTSSSKSGVTDSLRLLQQSERFELSKIILSSRRIPLIAMRVSTFLRKYSLIKYHLNAQALKAKDPDDVISGSDSQRAGHKADQRASQRAGQRVSQRVGQNASLQTSQNYSQKATERSDIWSSGRQTGGRHLRMRAAHNAIREDDDEYSEWSERPRDRWRSEAMAVRCSGRLSTRISLATKWLEEMKEAHMITYSDADVRIQGDEIRMSSKIRSALDLVWADLLVRCVTHCQAVFRGRKVRRAFELGKLARLAILELETAYHKASQQAWKYFSPPVLRGITSGDELLARIEAFQQQSQSCDWFICHFFTSRRMHQLRRTLDDLREHAALLRDCEVMLHKEETQATAIDALLHRVTQHGLQSDAISMITLRASKIKAEEIWRRKIVRALKRNNVAGVTAVLEQIRLNRAPNDIISINLRHLMSEFEKRKDFSPGAASQPHGIRPAWLGAAPYGANKLAAAARGGRPLIGRASYLQNQERSIQETCLDPYVSGYLTKSGHFKPRTTVSEGWTFSRNKRGRGLFFR